MKWSNTGVSSGKSRERPSIHASSYMILHSLDHIRTQMGAKKGKKALSKYQQYETIWNLAMTALKEVDEVFANNVTAIAVTHNFTGSPHIDKQNTGPFYGLSLGDFEDLTGGVQVECSARVVCETNTKNRWGKCDGRFPHWVSPYDVVRCYRYSLICCRTSGVVDPVSAAIFNVPEELVVA